MKRLIAPILIATPLLAGCAESERTLSQSIERYKGEPLRLDPKDLENAVQTSRGRAEIADAVSVNPLLDFEGEHLAYVRQISGTKLDVHIEAPGNADNVDIYLSDLGNGVVPRAEIVSIDLAPDHVRIQIEFENLAEPVEYDIPLDGSRTIQANAFTGEVFDPNAKP